MWMRSKKVVRMQKHKRHQGKERRWGELNPYINDRPDGPRREVDRLCYAGEMAGNAPSIHLIVPRWKGGYEAEQLMVGW